MARPHHHSVYVVELHKDVLYDRRFVAANPRFDRFLPCVYVGATGLTPEQRFANHKAGRQANRFVRASMALEAVLQADCYTGGWVAALYNGFLSGSLSASSASRARSSS